MIADPRQDHAQVEVQLGILGVELHAAAKRLDLVLVEHLVQLVELGLGAGVLGILLHALLLAVPGLFQAADLRVLVDRRQTVVVGIGLEALGQDLLGLVEIAVLPIDVGQLDVGVNGRRDRS